MIKVLDCKKIKEEELMRLKKELPPSLTLAVIQIGTFEENEVYLKNKQKLASQLGVLLSIFSFDEKSKKEEIVEKIKELNEDPKITGIIIQKPILSKYSYQELVDDIREDKDVDGLTSMSKKKWKEQCGLLPCTTKSIIKILEYYRIRIENKKIALLGKSELSTLPFYEKYKDQSKITLCDSKTENIKEVIQSSDIIISAIGKPCYFTKDYFKNGQVLLDVGINYQRGKLVGDIDFFSLEESNLNLELTKVPGGVGLLTPLYLFDNLGYANILQNEKSKKK